MKKKMLINQMKSASQSKKIDTNGLIMFFTETNRLSRLSLQVVSTCSDNPCWINIEIKVKNNSDCCRGNSILTIGKKILEYGKFQRKKKSIQQKSEKVEIKNLSSSLFPNSWRTVWAISIFLRSSANSNLWSGSVDTDKASSLYPCVHWIHQKVKK